jgi:hypothetical protein
MPQKESSPPYRHASYRHAGSEAEHSVRRSAALIDQSRDRLARTREATWDCLIRAWRQGAAAQPAD